MRAIAIVIIAMVSFGVASGDPLSDFLRCADGPCIPVHGECLAFDLDADGDVDQSDFGIFQRQARLQSVSPLDTSDGAAAVKCYLDANDDASIPADLVDGAAVADGANKKWFDLSGYGNHAVKIGTTNSPVLRTNYFKGLKSVVWTSPQGLHVPDLLPETDGPRTIIFIGRYRSAVAGRNFIGDSSSSKDPIPNIQIGTANSDASRFKVVHTTTQYCMSKDTDWDIFWVRHDPSDQSTGLSFGRGFSIVSRRNPSTLEPATRNLVLGLVGAAGLTGDIAALCYWDEALTYPQLYARLNWLSQRYKLPVPDDGVIVYDGDSVMAGEVAIKFNIGPNTGWTIPSAVTYGLETQGHRLRVHQAAVSGSTIHMSDAVAGTAVDAVLNTYPSTAKKIVVIQSLHNNLWSGPSGPIAYQRLVTYVANRRAAGAQKIVLVMPGPWMADTTTLATHYINKYNDFLACMAVDSSFVDEIVDWRTTNTGHTAMGDLDGPYGYDGTVTGNPWYYDLVHPHSEGYHTLSPLVLDGVKSILAN